MHPIHSFWPAYASFLSSAMHGMLSPCAWVCRMRATLLDVAYNQDRLHVGAAMREMVVDDCLMSTIDPGLNRLATSNAGTASSLLGDTDSSVRARTLYQFGEVRLCQSTSTLVSIIDLLAYTPVHSTCAKACWAFNFGFMCVGLLNLSRRWI